MIKVFNIRKIKIFKQNKNTILLILIIVLIVLSGNYFYSPKSNFKNSTENQNSCNNSPNLFSVKEVIDGDTVILDNSETIRYLGIDTPEIHHPEVGEECGGQEAKEANEKLVQGKKIRFEKDLTDKDQYGRLLRFVFTEDGDFINYELIRQGYGQVFSMPPDRKFEKIFIDAQLTAKKENLGIWSKCLNKKGE